MPWQPVSAMTSGTVMVIHAANVSHLKYRSFAELPLLSEHNLQVRPDSKWLGYMHAYEMLYTARWIHYVND